MDQEQIKKALTAMLTDVAAKARQDAIDGESDIGSIFRKESEHLESLDPKAIEEAILAIDKATSTKAGARRLINGLMFAAKAAARIAFPA